jgi:hypothetical protein
LVGNKSWPAFRGDQGCFINPKPSCSRADRFASADAETIIDVEGDRDIFGVIPV